MSTRGVFVFVSLVSACMCGNGFGGAICQAYAQRTIQVVLKDGDIQPGAMTVTQNTRVDIEIVNQGTKDHNLVIPDFYIFTQNLSPGQKVSVGFSPDKTGAFPYYSDAGGSPELGMRGTLHVRA